VGDESTDRTEAEFWQIMARMQERDERERRVEQELAAERMAGKRLREAFSWRSREAERSRHDELLAALRRLRESERS
jgi:hypothetical protein